MFVPLVETAIAFSAVMLAVSLFVSALVQLIQSVLHWRGITLIEMLAQTLHGFKDFHEADHSHDEALAKRFAVDILTDPSLHASSVLKRFEGDPDKLAQLIEYIHPDDLITLIYSHAGANKDVDKPLPAKWTGDLVSEYATAHHLARYIRRWFQTVEATHAQEFKRKMRRLTLTVSCTIVVLFCLDGLALVRTLWRHRTAAEAITKQVDTLRDTAARLGVVPPSSSSLELDTTAKQLALEMQKTATILDEASVGIGWQNSWIVKRWCAFKHYCEGPVPTGGRMFTDLLLWLTGLAFSCVMLSLGAPFWVTTLSSLIRLQNEVQRTKQQPPPPGIGSQTLP